VKGDELYLSAFDGAHVFLYRAKLASADALAGDFWVGTAHHERWAGKRDNDAALPDAYALTAVTGPHYMEFVDEVKTTLDQLLSES
jgi:hypothetical protein